MRWSVAGREIRRFGPTVGAGIAIVAVLVLPLLIFTSVAVHTIESDITDQAVSDRLEATALIARHLDNELRDVGERLTLLAARPTVIEALRRRDAAALRPLLADLRRSTRGRYNSVAAYEPSGVLFARDPGAETLGQSFAQRDFFQGALTTSGPYVSEVYRTQAAPMPAVVAVAVAIRDGASLLGVIHVTVRPDSLLAAINTQLEDPGSEILIVDKRQQIVASSAHREPLAPIERPVSSRPGTALVMFEGAEHVVVAAVVPLATWSLYAIDDPAVVLAPERQLADNLRRAATVSAVIATLTGVGFAVLFALVARQRSRLAAGNATLATVNARLAELNLEIQRSEALNRAVLDTAIDGIIVMDEAGLIQSVNPAAERIFGWTAEEVIGRNVSLLMSDAYHPARDGYLDHDMTTGETKINGSGREVEGLRKGGTRFPVQLGMSELRVGEVRLFAGITRDISAEKSLLRAAEQANRSKSEFLANMSHELRTPLNAILGFSQLLEERVGASLEERQRVWLRNIQTAGTHLLDLINDVLDISKVEAGRYEIRPERMALADLLAPVLATARRDADARGLALEASETPATAVLVDPLRTRQVLHNLLSNAAKFTERGGRVRLTTAISGRDLLFEVEDTGIGIRAADQDRVFGVFERLHEGRYEASGTGLGLALTKRIVELHGGSLTFRSEEGVGTTFTVRFPEAVHAEMVGPRVLIVEDDPRDAALVAEVAADLGLPVEIVATGVAALATTHGNPPIAIVLDLRLPDMRGEAVLEALQADSATRRIPVIVVTVEDDEGRTRPLGVADHLTKPIETARLRRWLDQVADELRGPA